MKYLIGIILIFLSASSYGQTVRANDVVADKNLYAPVFDTIVAPGRVGDLRVRVQDTAIYMAQSMTAGIKRWTKIAKITDAQDITGKLNYSDTATMLLNYFNNVGYSLLRSGQVVRFDSATAANYFIRRKDSSVNGGYYPYATNPKNYLVAADISGKVNISDTASMLNPYLRKVDTASLSGRINLKVNISDTASMLSPYIHDRLYGLLKSGQNLYLDSATVFSQVRATIPAETDPLAWKLLGNAGTSSLTNFIGTIDSVDFVIKAYNIELGRFLAAKQSVAITYGTASGTNSTAMSYGIASGEQSVAMTNGTASSDYSVAMNNGVASGSYSTAIGAGKASGYYSTAISSGTASGYYSIGIGVGTKSKSYSGIVVGVYNDSTNAVSQTSIDALNRIFQIGNGTADNARSNAMTVLGNGNVGIGDATPAALFTVGTSDAFQINSSGNVSTSGTLSVTSTATFSSLTASSAVYTDGSKNLTSTIPTSGSLGYWTRSGTTVSLATGTDAVSLGGTLAVTTSITNPLLIGGSGTTQTLTYKTTTGVGATGADHIFLVGNNGATEAMRILNNSNVSIGLTAPFPNNTVAGSLWAGNNGTNGSWGNIVAGRGAATLGITSSGSYGAVGANFVVNTSGGLVRVSADVVSLIDFASGGFIFKNAGSSTANSAISLTTLMTLNSSGNLSITGTLGVTGVTTLANQLLFSTSTSQTAGSISKNSTYGLTFFGVSGSTYDFGLFNKNGAEVMVNPTGTANANFAGNISLSAATGRINVTTGANSSFGNATLVAGTVTVTTTAATANSLIYLTRKTSGGTIGTAITYTTTSGSFTISSDNILDTSVFTYMIIN